MDDNDRDSPKGQQNTQSDSAKSEKRLITDGKEGESRKKQKIDQTKTEKDGKVKPPTPDEKPQFRGPFGISIAATVIWYVAICILFVIAFVSLILSLIYFVTNTTEEQVIKLYGIAGSGALAIVAFCIIFLDCCNNLGKVDHEQEALYLAYKEKEEREKELAMRRTQRIKEGKEEAPKPFLIQHQRPPSVESTSTVPTPPPPVHHHIPFPPPTTYHHPFVCPICHDLHASGNARHNLTDVGVDTSDKLLAAPKKKVVIKSTRDVQTDPQVVDAEQGTQTDRNAGTQTTSMELSGMPGNITEIIHETTILKAPRNLIATLKKSMAEQDKKQAMTRAVTDSKNTLTMIDSS